MKKILAISGNDCSGGAGLIADTKIITAHRQYAIGVTTCITAQNSTGLYGIFDVEPDFIGMQLDCVLSDFPPDAVKIGVVLSTGNIREIIRKLKEYNAKNIVVDPAIMTGSGNKLLNDNAMDDALNLLPLGDVITPNLMDAEFLTGIHIENKEDMLKAARLMHEKYNTAVVLKGGHLPEDCGADDLLVMDGHEQWFAGERIESNNLYGTGNAFSTLIACNLAEGLSIPDAVARAKEYLTEAVTHELNFGRGDGPINTIWNL